LHTEENSFFSSPFLRIAQLKSIQKKEKFLIMIRSPLFSFLIHQKFKKKKKRKFLSRATPNLGVGLDFSPAWVGFYRDFHKLQQVQKPKKGVFHNLAKVFHRDFHRLQQVQKPKKGFFHRKGGAIAIIRKVLVTRKRIICTKNRHLYTVSKLRMFSVANLHRLTKIVTCVKVVEKWLRSC
jgi:hypothetical protein